MTLSRHFALTTLALALTAPLAAQASSLWHPAANEAGFTEHPDHFKSTKTRAEVRAEVEAARKDGTLLLIQRSSPLPVRSAQPPMTRQQVIDELRNEPPAARQARLEQLTGG